MKLYRIKNKYVFGKNKHNAKAYDPNGTHDYAAYYSKKAKKWRLVGLIHVLDPKRQAQIQKKELMMMNFGSYKTKNKVSIPSGVKNKYLETDINGQDIDLKKMGAVPLNKGKLSKSESAKIRAFAKTREK